MRERGGRVCVCPIDSSKRERERDINVLMHFRMKYNWEEI